MVKRATSASGKAPALVAAGLLASALMPASCLFETAAPQPGSERRLHYEVAIGGTADSVHCRVQVRILDWPSGEPMVFQAPPYYTDNPKMPVPGLRAADFSAEDSLGRAVTPRDTAPGFEQLDGDFIVVPSGTRVITYEVDHDRADPRRFGLPMPGLKPGVQAIDGAYYFLLPLRGERFSTQWRLPVSIGLDFRMDPGFTLVGQDPSVHLKTNYELMFVRAVVNPIRITTFPVGNHQVTTYATSSDTFDIEDYNGMLAKCMKLVEDSILPLPEKNWFAGETPVFYGIEGTQGYWFRPDALTRVFVHTHELTHTFVGVRHGEFDDPWWKEGVTNYIGELLPVQAGLYPESLFVGEFTAPMDTFSAIRDYPLGSPHVRNRLFLPQDSAYQSPNDPASFTSLVYGKGGEAAMIIDRYILEASHGRKSIFDLIRAVVRHYYAAFTREDLISEVSRLSGGDARGFLQDLLDKPGGFSADSLVHTYNALRSMGRFLPGVPKASLKITAGPGFPVRPAFNPHGKL
jgi:hypothetical protein